MNLDKGSFRIQEILTPIQGSWAAIPRRKGKRDLSERKGNKGESQEHLAGLRNPNREAVVLSNHPEIKREIRYYMKQV